MDKTTDPQVQTMIENMSEKTGNTLEGWFKLIKAQKLEKHGEIMKLLKGEHGVSHGYANTITLFYRQNLSGELVSDDDLVAAQYGKKAHMKSWYDKLISEVHKFGADVKLAPKKSYVSLRRAKQFGIIQPSVKTRMDIGINLKGQKASGILIEGDKWSGMCSHRIEIFSLDEINEEVIDWLRKAYEAAG
jgi:hypothetical protein